MASTSRNMEEQSEQTKRLYNPQRNRWNPTNTTATISENGLTATATGYLQSVFAVQGFQLAGPQFRADNFQGTILYYFEVTGTGTDDDSDLNMGLSDGNIPGEESEDEDSTCVGTPDNSYAFWGDISQCLLQGQIHNFEQPIGAILPALKLEGEGDDVLGCGLLLDPNDHTYLFFTLNGRLVDQKFRICPTVDVLLPTVTMAWNMSVEANFDGPFEYNIDECPGLELDQILRIN